MGSGPVYWIGPAAKTGQQLVGQIGDNPSMVSHFGARDNAEKGPFPANGRAARSGIGSPPSLSCCNRRSASRAATLLAQARCDGMVRASHVNLPILSIKGSTCGRCSPGKL
jgi:hypothetical protein